MKIKNLVLLPLLLALVPAFGASSLSSSELPAEFQASIPLMLGGGLKLEGLEDRCDGCKPWRYIDYYSNGSKEPIKQEKVSVKEGYRAMYAYPDTEYFSNTKIEQSISGEYEHDKRVVIEAITHEYNRKKERVASYLKNNIGLKEKMEPHRAKGKDYITFEKETVNGYEYVSYTENVIGLLGVTSRPIVKSSPRPIQAGTFSNQPRSFSQSVQNGISVCLSSLPGRASSCSAASSIQCCAYSRLI